MPTTRSITNIREWWSCGFCLGHLLNEQMSFFIIWSTIERQYLNLYNPLYLHYHGTGRSLDGITADPLSITECITKGETLTSLLIQLNLTYVKSSIQLISNKV